MSEKRKLSVHPAMIYQTIFAQAGTLSKALLELIMNSIDSHSTAVHITLERGIFSASDDGIGFKSRQEITDWFEVFGSPHLPGDRTFGKFRIGRGQIMSFASTCWRTNVFQMKVDIKNEGLDYHLKDNLEIVVGCSISGDFYETLMPSELESTKRELVEMARYAQIPVFVNEKQINTPAEKVKWSHESDLAYIKYTSTGGLKLYNLGVFVREYPGHQFGVSGTVVSKKALEVNTARNDILNTKCPIWKELKKVFAKQAGATTTRKKRLNDTDRQFLANQLRCGELPFRENTALRLLIDTTGRYEALSRLDNIAYNLPFTVSPREGSAIADRLHQRKMAYVLHPKMLEMFDVETPQELISLFQKLENAGDAENRTWYLDSAKFVPFDELADLLDGGYEGLANKDLSLVERLALTAINDNHYFLVHAINKTLGTDIRRRTVKAGVSDVAEAWTNGIDTIHVERKVLKEALKGHIGFTNIVMLLLHEYMHNEASTSSHEHDDEFYKNFHDVSFTTTVQCTSIGDASVGMTKEFVRQLRRNDKKVKQNFLKFEDQEATVGDVVAMMG